MKENAKAKAKPNLKPLILTIFLLFLTGFSFAGTANRVTSPTFTTNSIHAISLIHKPQVTNHKSQVALAFGVRKSTKTVKIMVVNGTLPAPEHPLIFFNLTLNTYHLTLRPPAGNLYLINRYYNADRGGFLSPDRYRYVRDATPFTYNLYQYGLSNPLLNVDPEGTQIAGAESHFQQMQAMDKIRHEHLMGEFAGTGVTDPEFFIYEHEESGYKYLGHGQFGYNPRRASDLYKYGGKLGDYIVHDVYIVREGKLTLAKKKIPVQYLGSGQLDVDVEFYALAIGSFQPTRLALREGGIGAATRRLLSESIDNIAGLPATDVARGATKLANPRFWRAFNRDILRSESEEASGFFSKFLHDERGFAKIKKEGLSLTDYARRRAVLNQKFGRTGNLHFDINFRGLSGEVGDLDKSTKNLLFSASMSDERVLIVGERMFRVQRFAGTLRKYGFRTRTYSPRYFPGLGPSSLKANREWLRYWTIRNESPVIDIGIEVGGKRSPFYKIEWKSLYENWHYMNVSQVKLGY